MRLPAEQIVLTVDLSSGRIGTQRIGALALHKFVGGRGVGAKLLYQRMVPGADPLGPGNLLIFSAGALTGTLAPAAARTTIVSKSPMTNRYLKCNAGGHWGAELRYAGYDHVVITGASDSPVYLWIDGDRVQIREAGHLWGMGTRETESTIRAELGDEQIETAVVGPAAENGVRFAAIIISHFDAAGRGGIGTVMGAKRLKAVAVRGTGGIPVADVYGFKAVSKIISTEIVTDDACSRKRRYGIVSSIGDPGRGYSVGARNFRGTIGNEATRLSGQTIAELGYFRAGLACTSCGVGCRHFLRNDSSRFGPLRDGLPEIEPAIALGSQCGVTDTDAVLQASSLCDDLGLDVLSTGFTIAWAMECYEKGLITRGQADGLEVRFGNAEMLLGLVERIAWRQGLLGDLLAEGTQRASAEVGGESWKWAMQARGLEQSSPDSRELKGYALGFAVNARGPDHLQAQPMAEFGGTMEARALVRKVCGDDAHAVPHSSEKKADLVRWHEDCQAVTDALGVCMFLAVGFSYMMSPERMAALLSSAWGVEIDCDELMTVGRRIVTLERCFNVREGADRRTEEHLPWRMMHEPLQHGPNAGNVTSPEELDRMLDEYYSLHGWNIETGWPSRGTLTALDLEAMCSDLGDLIGERDRCGLAPGQS